MHLILLFYPANLGSLLFAERFLRRPREWTHVTVFDQLLIITTRRANFKNLWDPPPLKKTTTNKTSTSLWRSGKEPDLRSIGRRLNRQVTYMYHVTKCSCLLSRISTVHGSIYGENASESALFVSDSASSAPGYPKYFEIFDQQLSMKRRPVPTRFVINATTDKRFIVNIFFLQPTITFDKHDGTEWKPTIFEII